MSFHHLLVFFGVVFASTAFAYELKGKVLKIFDGESFLLQDKQKQKHRVKVLGIAAPIEGQPNYLKSKIFLRHLIQNRNVVVEWFKTQGDCLRGGKNPNNPCQFLGKVFLDQEDISLQILLRGWAWHDPRTLSEQTTPDRTRYIENEDKARKKKRGLWSTKNPVPPWQYVPSAPKSSGKKK